MEKTNTQSSSSSSFSVVIHLEKKRRFSNVIKRKKTRETDREKENANIHFVSLYL